MAVSDALMRRHSHVSYSRSEAEKAAKSRGGVVIQSIRGRQWFVVTGPAVIRESMQRLRESNAYLGLSPPKIVADFRVRR